MAMILFSFYPHLKASLPTNLLSTGPTTLESQNIKEVVIERGGSVRINLYINSFFRFQMNFDWIVDFGSNWIGLGYIQIEFD
jgi:hypothetical protein